MKISKNLVIVLIAFSFLPALVFRLIEWKNGSIGSFSFFLESLAVNSIFSIIVTLSIAWVILSILYWLNQYIPWNDNVLKRLFAEIFSTFPVSILLGFLLGSLIYLIHPYNQKAYGDFVFGFIIISVIMNLILVAISDWFYFFNRWKDSLLQNQIAKTNNAILERENIRSQYEVLKNQINPHFLFNSLNTLSALIHHDINKAEEFIEEFSDLYRYILDQNENETVQLEEEISICKSYLFLQKIRFEDGLSYSFNLSPETIGNIQVFPLSIQTLLENALKHNLATKERPLKIEVRIEGNFLIISNNLQERKTLIKSTGIGLKNLKEKYRYYNLVPRFERTEKSYKCYLPLIMQKP